MNTQFSVPLEKLVEQAHLVNRTPEVSLEGKALTTPEINRPALQLTGYFDYFEADRLQIVGYVEYTYLETLERERKRVIYEQLLSAKVPALVYTTRTIPDDDMLELAVKYGIPKRIIHSHNAQNMDTKLRGMLHEANRSIHLR